MNKNYVTMESVVIITFKGDKFLAKRRFYNYHMGEVQLNHSSVCLIQCVLVREDDFRVRIKQEGMTKETRNIDRDRGRDEATQRIEDKPRNKKPQERG